MSELKTPKNERQKKSEGNIKIGVNVLVAADIIDLPNLSLFSRQMYEIGQ
jgi:hypothetical protein